MVSVLIFDLDGVLVDADTLHFVALNQALLSLDAPTISAPEHDTIYKGLSTDQKLQVLVGRMGLSPALIPELRRLKQLLTLDLIHRTIGPDPEKILMLKRLRDQYRIAVCSNAKTESVLAMLCAADLLAHCDIYLGNDDVKCAKPAPDIYYHAMDILGVEPDDCAIIEDSEVGRQAARASGATLIPVSDPSQVNFYRISSAIKKIQTPRVVIPAAGQGRRFLEAGYLYPKPLIEVEGKPMIEHVLHNVSSLGDPLVILQRKHCERYCTDDVISQMRPGTEIVTVDSLTAGAACTVLECEHCINDVRELILVNSDQVLDYDLGIFLRSARASSADGAILTFQATDRKWSYAAVDANGLVTRVAEKEVISAHATVGVYYFKHGRDFVRAAKQMIAKNIRVNGEFYVCPVFSELIECGGKVIIHEISSQLMHGLGTPEDLYSYLKRRPSTTILEVDEHSNVPSQPVRIPVR